MKYLKMLGLAAIAALALAAFGASTASATVVCTTNANCTTGHNGEGGQMYTTGDVITGNATSPVLTSSTGNVTCASSQTNVKLTGTGGSGSAVPGEIETVTFTSCTLKDLFGVNHSCNDIDASGFTGNVSLGAAPNGTLTVQNAFVELVCPGFIECSFGAVDLKLPITGGNPATVTANKLALEKEEGGFLCPSESLWDASYKTTTAVWVQKG